MRPHGVAVKAVKGVTVTPLLGRPVNRYVGGIMPGESAMAMHAPRESRTRELIPFDDAFYSLNLHKELRFAPLRDGSEFTPLIPKRRFVDPL
jgi:hypothetical protein